MEQLQSVGIEALPSLDISRVYEEPYLNDVGFMVNTSIDSKEVVLPSLPWDFGVENSMNMKPAPKLGSGNKAIYEELLGLDAATVNQMIEQKIIY